MPLDWLIIALRFIQFGGAMILFGSSLFLLYGRLLPSDASPGELRWAKSLLLRASLALLIATPLQFLVQTAHLAGSLVGVFQDGAFQAALLGMSFGRSSLARTGLAFVALVLVLVSPADRRLFLVSALLGAAICASFAWMGHGAAAEGAAGWLHLFGDIAHSLAAAGWLGALVVFWIASRENAPRAISASNLAISLASFAGAGTFIVAVILASGLLNSVSLIGWNLPKALFLPYGQLLAVKLLFFAGMLWLAARNRFRHTPALASAVDGAADLTASLAELRRSIRAETLSGVAILILVAWLGTLAPAIVQ